MPRITLYLTDDDKALVDRLKSSEISASKLLRDALRFHFAEDTDQQALLRIAQIVESRLR